MSSHAGTKSGKLHALVRGVVISPLYRRCIYALAGLIVLTGLAWMVLGYFLHPDDFSDPLRLWRHRVLVAHGCAAYGMVWVLGTLFPQHQWGAWKARHHRWSGGVLSLVLLLLALTGLLLYYPPADEWRDAYSLLHQVLGGLFVLALPLHAVLGRRRRLAAGAMGSAVPHGKTHPKTT
jgi:hypothetical protein